MSEHDELQEILEKSSGSNRGERGESPYYIAPGGSNSCQWIIEGNDSFQATSATVKTIPSGMYKVSVDDRGFMHWRLVPIITDKLVNLNDPASDEIIAGIRKFWASEAEFKKLGMIYKRGILLWGPAGSGKTVTVTLLMRELVNCGGIVLFCEHPQLVVHGLEQLRKIEPNRRLIVVFEDIEEIIGKHGEHALLAILDGEYQVANVVNIATTNFPEQLGARIVNRPSRFDHVKKIGMPSAAAREEYFESTVPKPFPTHDLRKWVEDTEGMSIAHLRELVVAVKCLSEPYDKTIERLKKMTIKVQSSSEFKATVGMAPAQATTPTKRLV